MKVMIVGGGGREHAIAMSVAKSSKVEKIYCLPGNAGIEEVAECAPIGPMEFEKIRDFAKEKKIDLAVIGMDDPLVGGLTDVLEEAGIQVDCCKIGEGGSKSQLWCEIIANAFHIPDCSVMKNKDSAPVGATILAGMGIQAYKTWDEAVEKLVRETKLKQDQKMAEFYETNYKIYKKIYPALKEIYHNIGNISKEENA